jgi:hypothetical protein
MSPYTDARLHLAVELAPAGRHPAAAEWARLDPAALLTAAHHVALARTAARRGLDLVFIPDTFVDDQPVLEAVAVASRIAPVVPGIGLVPTAAVTHTEPFHVSKAIATLDLISGGRAGWEPAVSRTPAEAALFGRKSAAPPDELWREAAEAVEVSVVDDGSGGADEAGGGLRGLADRVAAVDGHLELHSPPRGGTRVTCELPCA